LFFAELLEIFDLIFDQLEFFLHLLVGEQHEFAASETTAGAARTTADEAAASASLTAGASGSAEAAPPRSTIAAGAAIAFTSLAWTLLLTRRVLLCYGFGNKAR